MTLPPPATRRRAGARARGGDPPAAADATAGAAAPGALASGAGAPAGIAGAAPRRRPAGPDRAAQPPVPTGGSQAVGRVTPPGLLSGVRNAEPEYPFASRQRGEQGVVGVVIRVSEAGAVLAVELAQSSGFPALDESARRAVMQWKLKPAMRDGVPIPGSIRTAIHFSLG